MFGLLAGLMAFCLLFAVALLGLISSQKAVNRHDASRRARKAAESPMNDPR